MNGKNIAIGASIAVILLGLAGGAAWLYAQNDQEKVTSQKSSSQPNQKPDNNKAKTTENEQPKTTAQPGTYQAYSQANLQTAGERERVLFFHAPWCPQCRALEADIEAKGVPAGVAMFKIDYDSNQDLRQKYGVTQQTTVVLVDENGNKIRDFLPYSDPTMANALNGLGL